MNELPNGWSVATLGDLLERIEAGLNVKCEERPPEAGEQGLVKISAVTWGKFDELQSKTLPTDAVPGQKNRIQEGDLLISRANTIELVGASVIVGPISRELYLSDKVLRLCVHEPSKRWINYALKTPVTRKAIEEASSGNQLSMRNIAQDKLKSLSFPLAPEAEQTRIADKLDTVLSRVDAVNARLARVAPLLKRFRQSVLAAATSGRLTEDWRGTNAADFPWPTCLTRQAGKIQLGRQRSPKYHAGENMRPYLRVQNVFEDLIDVSDVMAMEFDAADFERYHLKVGDILLNEGQSPEYLGRPAMFRGEVADACFTNTLVRFQAFDHVSPDFALLVFRHYMHSGRYIQEGTTTTNIAHLGAGRFGEVEFPLPTLAEQKEIAQRAQTLFAFADRLEARLKAAQTAAQRLTPAVLAKAFRGELVPQDPADEPAAELLKRLAAQRAQDNAGGVRRRGRPVKG